MHPRCFLAFDTLAFRGECRQGLQLPLPFDPWRRAQSRRFPSKRKRREFPVGHAFGEGIAEVFPAAPSTVVERLPPQTALRSRRAPRVPLREPEQIELAL